MNLQTLLADKHTSFSGIAYFAIEAFSQVAMIWFPQHKDEIDKTSHVLKGAAVAYMGVMAAGTKQVQTQFDQARSDVKQAIETGHTETLAKHPDPPKV